MVFLFFTCLTLPFVCAQTNPVPPSSPLSIADAVAQVSGSVVIVKTEVATGTGFYATIGGDVVTARHVVLLADGTQAKDIKISLPISEVNNGLPGFDVNGGLFTENSEVIAEDALHDLAILRPVGSPFMRGVVMANGKDLVMTHPATLCSRNLKLRSGEPIFTVGHPLNDRRLIATSGIIASSENVTEPSTGAIENSYLVDMLINPGNSGGPVFWLPGNCVIGLADSVELKPLNAVAGGHTLSSAPTFRITNPDGTITAFNLEDSAGLGTLIPQMYIIEVLDKAGYKSSSSTSQTHSKSHD